MAGEKEGRRFGFRLSGFGFQPVGSASHRLTPVNLEDFASRSYRVRLIPNSAVEGEVVTEAQTFRSKDNDFYL